MALSPVVGHRTDLGFNPFSPILELREGCKFTAKIISMSVRTLF